MELRKIQITGGSSYIVSLPKDWIENQGINKGDQVALYPQPDGSLRISSSLVEEESSTTKIIEVDKDSNPRHIFRLLIASYIVGYSQIIVTAKKNITLPIHECVSDFTQRMIGPEIVEESSKSITIKDLLNPIEMPFEKTARRMHLLVTNMMTKVMTALENREPSLASVVRTRDIDVNRLHWLVGRQLNLIVQNSSLLRKMGTTQENAFFYYMITRFFERIGDHIVVISDQILQLIRDEVPTSLNKRIAQASDYAMSLVSDSIDAWFKTDLETAQKVIDSLEQLRVHYDRIKTFKGPVLSVESSVALDRLAESVGRIGAYATDISEIVIDNLV
ncbi:MAG: PhoU domain-containing protein [Candidatus Thorarchaeota archaeon]